MYPQDKRHDGFRITHEPLERALDKHQACSNAMRGGDPRWMRRLAESTGHGRKDNPSKLHRGMRVYVPINQRQDAVNNWFQPSQRKEVEPLKNYYAFDTMMNEHAKKFRPVKLGIY